MEDSPIKIRFRKGSGQWAVLECPFDQFEELIQTCNQYFYPDGPKLDGPFVRTGVDLPTAAKTLGWPPQRLWYYLMRNRVKGARYQQGVMGPGKTRQRGSWDIPIPVTILDKPEVPPVE